MSDIYRIYEPGATDKEDVCGYLRIDCFGEYSWVQQYDTGFHVIDERQVNLERNDPHFHEAAGMDREHGYAIMPDMDFYRKQRAQKQREYRQRCKEREQQKTQEQLDSLVSRMQQILLFPGAWNTEPEDIYQISTAAENAGDKQLSVYIRNQGDRMKAQELSPRDAVRNVIRAYHAKQEGGDREEGFMVAETGGNYPHQNHQPNKTRKEIEI